MIYHISSVRLIERPLLDFKDFLIEKKQDHAVLFSGNFFVYKQTFMNLWYLLVQEFPPWSDLEWLKESTELFHSVRW